MDVGVPGLGSESKNCKPMLHVLRLCVTVIGSGANDVVPLDCHVFRLANSSAELIKMLYGPGRHMVFMGRVGLPEKLLIFLRGGWGHDRSFYFSSNSLSIFAYPPLDGEGIVAASLSR